MLIPQLLLLHIDPIPTGAAGSDPIRSIDRSIDRCIRSVDGFD
jgi:hypothetical protein